MASRARELTDRAMSARELCRVINRVIFHEWGYPRRPEPFPAPGRQPRRARARIAPRHPDQPLHRVPARRAPVRRAGGPDRPSGPVHARAPHRRTRRVLHRLLRRRRVRSRSESGSSSCFRTGFRRPTTFSRRSAPSRRSAAPAGTSPRSSRRPEIPPTPRFSSASSANSKNPPRPMTIPADTERVYTLDDLRSLEPGRAVARRHRPPGRAFEEPADAQRRARRTPPAGTGALPRLGVFQIRYRTGAAPGRR